MSDITFLAVGYIGMLFSIAVWTWTVLSRSRSLESRISAIESSLKEEE